jgi:hypothetical protein
MSRATRGPGRPPGLDPSAARATIERLNRDGERLAARFDLRYRAIAAERPSVRSRYGICYEDGLIKIRLQHATRGTPLKYSSLVNTLCHELAHLRHFDHSDAFKVFYEQILVWARRAGIYRPGPAPETEPPPRTAKCGVTTEERRRFLEQMHAVAGRARLPSAAAACPVQLRLFES